MIYYSGYQFSSSKIYQFKIGAGGTAASGNVRGNDGTSSTIMEGSNTIFGAAGGVEEGHMRVVVLEIVQLAEQVDQAAVVVLVELPELHQLANC